MAPTKKLDFGQAVKRLEEIVQCLEQDEVTLEESSKLFEEGVKLAKLCSDRLRETEEKIERLTRDDAGNLTSSPVDRIDE